MRLRCEVAEGKVRELRPSGQFSDFASDAAAFHGFSADRRLRRRTRESGFAKACVPAVSNRGLSRSPAPESNVRRLRRGGRSSDIFSGRREGSRIQANLVVPDYPFGSFRQYVTGGRISSSGGIAFPLTPFLAKLNPRRKDEFIIL